MNSFVSPVGGVFSRRQMLMYDARGGLLRVAEGRLEIGTWNIEGLTDVKLIELQEHMLNMQLDVLCLTEVRKPGAESYATEEGFYFILFGGVVGERDYAGVGFLIAPYARQCMIGFAEHFDRLVTLRMRVVGGQFGVIVAYAPHNGLEYVFRQSFYSELTEIYDKFKCYGLKDIMGDLNAQRHYHQPGEEKIRWAFSYGKQQFSR